MRNRKTWITLFAGLALLTSGYAVAENGDRQQDSPGFFSRLWEGTKSVFGISSGRDEDENRYRGTDTDDYDVLRRFFTDDEKRILRDYYGGEYSRNQKKQKPLPPGLKKKVERGGELPPGWQKKMARGEVIPEDVYRYGHRPPDEVRRRLPRQPDGTDIIYVEGKVARVLDATRRVIDVFDL